MLQNEFLLDAVSHLENLDLPYIVTGSMASMFHGEYRLTHDVDIVIQIEPWQVDDFCAEFCPPMYFTQPESVTQAIARKDQFNVIAPTAGFKIDFMIAEESTFDRLRFRRAEVHRVVGKRTARFASPEDIAIKKMVYYREGKSEKHIRDIVGLLAHCENFDREYAEHWVGLFGLTEIWTAILKRFEDPTDGSAA